MIKSSAIEWNPSGEISVGVYRSTDRYANLGGLGGWAVRG